MTNDLGEEMAFETKRPGMRRSMERQVGETMVAPLVAAMMAKVAATAI